MRKTFASLLVLTLLLLSLACCSTENDAYIRTEEVLRTKTEALLDSSTHFFQDDATMSLIEYDALGHYASAYLNLYEKTGTVEYLTIAETILDYLTLRKDLDKNGFSGWGLRFAWDAFKDGKTNDVNTVYTCTTTIIGEAFLKAFLLTGKPTYRTVLEEIHSTLLKDIGYWEKDEYACFWYSNSIYDHTYLVHNINAYSIRFLVEWASITGNKGDAPLINKIYAFEHDTQLKNGNWYYVENIEKRRKSDLYHWAMGGSAFYAAYEATGNNRYLEVARKTKEGLVTSHINKNFRILDDSSIKWGVPEFLIVLAYAAKYDKDDMGKMVLGHMLDDIGNAGEYLPSQNIMFHQTDQPYNYRTNALFAHALSLYFTPEK